MWKSEEEKLNRSGRRWRQSETRMPYRCAELFCEKCGRSLGIYDIVCTNLESMMYCEECVKEYVLNTPLLLSCGKVIEDHGLSVLLEYTNSHYASMVVNKTCYFNRHGRFIKVKGKRYYI